MDFAQENRFPLVDKEEATAKTEGVSSAMMDQVGAPIRDSIAKGLAERKGLVIDPMAADINSQIPATWLQPKSISRKKAAIDTHVAKLLTHAHDKLHDPNRVFSIFFEWRHRLSDERYWEFLKLTWIVAGKPEFYAAFAILFQSERPCRHFMMTVEEKEALDKMPDTLILYRAAASEHDGGLSWTSNLGFVSEYAAGKPDRKVITRTFKKKDVLCFIERRGEEEFVIIPEELKINHKAIRRKAMR